MADASLAGALDTATQARAREKTTGSYLSVGKDPEALAGMGQNAGDRNVGRC